MAISWDDFDKIWASTSPLTPYSFSDNNYKQGWNFVGATPPARQMWDSIQKANDEKFKFLRDNFGTPNIVTTASQMTDTSKVYVYMGSEAGWNNGHWYYYNGTAWADGGVYNSVAFMTDSTLSIAGQPADAKAVGDALALKADLAGCTFTGNVNVTADLSVAGASTLTGDVTASADLSVAGDSSLTNLFVSGTTALNGNSTAITQPIDDNSTKIATTEYVQAEIKPIEADVSANDKRISNIEKLLQGNLYDYQTDSTIAYTKNVPNGAMPYAGLELLGGKTVAWNQLVDSGTTTVATVSGHKYYTLIDGTASIVTSSGSAISVVDDTADMVMDLTLCYGAGNEPTTIEQFREMFPADYYEYNSGELLSAGVTKIIGDGKNLLPTQVANGSESGLTWVVNDDGSITFNGTTSAVVAVDYPIGTWHWDGITPCWLSGCPVNEGNQCWLYVFSDGDEEHASYAYSYEDYGTGVALSSKYGDLTGRNLHYRIRIGSGLTLNNMTFKPQLEYGNTATAFKKYQEPKIIYNVPAEIQSLDGYGWSAGSVYNYIDYERKVFVKNVGAVDCGKQSIEMMSFGFRIRLPDDSRTVRQGAQAVCSKYPTYYGNVAGYNATQREIAVSNLNLTAIKCALVNDDNYTTVDEFKTAMNGVYLYYELETPVETDISAYITDDNLIEVEAGGTLTFPNSNGDDYIIPVPSEETYMINLQEAVSNG